MLTGEGVENGQKPRHKSVLTATNLPKLMLRLNRLNVDYTFSGSYAKNPIFVEEDLISFLCLLYNPVYKPPGGDAISNVLIHFSVVRCGYMGAAVAVGTPTKKKTRLVA